MQTTTKYHRRFSLHLALIGIIGLLGFPSTSSATELTSDDPTPVPADDCTPQSAIVLEIDVATGDIYMVDAAGGLTLTDNEIDVYVGTLDRLLVDIQYSSGEWEVEISPTGQSTQTRWTRGGALRYWADTNIREYVFSSTPLAVSTMMNMTPILPDIVIRAPKDCPPDL